MSVTALRKTTDDEPSGGGYGAAGSIKIPPAAKVGLWVFMGVVTTLFSLLVSAYAMRLGFSDWRPIPELRQLWQNTAFLILGSAAMQWASVAARQGRTDHLKTGLIAGGVFALAFLGGQLWAWRQLSALNYFVASNPSSSFFYLITGLHGLHLIGGLLVWGKTTAKVWQGADMRLSVELTTLYWHFLLVVWLALFGLLFTGTPSIIQIICGRP